MKFLVLVLLTIKVVAYGQAEHIIIKPVGISDKQQLPIVISNGEVDTIIFDKTSNFGLDSNGNMMLTQYPYYLFVYDSLSYREIVKQFFKAQVPGKIGQYALANRFDIAQLKGLDTIAYFRCLNQDQSNRFLESVLSNNSLRKILDNPIKYSLRLTMFNSMTSSNVPNSLSLLIEKYYCIMNSKTHPCYE